MSYWFPRLFKKKIHLERNFLEDRASFEKNTSKIVTIAKLKLRMKAKVTAMRERKTEELRLINCDRNISLMALITKLKIKLKAMLTAIRDRKCEGMRPNCYAPKDLPLLKYCAASGKHYVPTSIDQYGSTLDSLKYWSVDMDTNHDLNLLEPSQDVGRRIAVFWKNYNKYFSGRVVSATKLYAHHGMNLPNNLPQGLPEIVPNYDNLPKVLPEAARVACVFKYEIHYDDNDRRTYYLKKNDTEYWYGRYLFSKTGRNFKATQFILFRGECDVPSSSSGINSENPDIISNVSTPTDISDVSLEVGVRVEAIPNAIYPNIKKRYYPGEISEVHDDNTYTIYFDDGDVSREPSRHVRSIYSDTFIVRRDVRSFSCNSTRRGNPELPHNNNDIHTDNIPEMLRSDSVATPDFSEISEEAAMEAASTSIQSAFRGYRQRKTFHEKHSKSINETGEEFISEEKKEGFCVICMNKRACYCLVKCGHIVACEDCESRIVGNCPVCRKGFSRKEDKIRVYFA